MTKLSSAAQAVVDALGVQGITALELVARGIAGAAIRAAADQVTPSDAVEPRNYLPMAIECQRIRSEILAIATELEGQ